MFMQNKVIHKHISDIWHKINRLFMKLAKDCNSKTHLTLLFIPFFVTGKAIGKR